MLEQEESFSALSEADDTTDHSSGNGESLIAAATGGVAHKDKRPVITDDWPGIH